jgi:hypothetical protein
MISIVELEDLRIDELNGGDSKACSSGDLDHQAGYVVVLVGHAGKAVQFVHECGDTTLSTVLA